VNGWISSRAEQIPFSIVVGSKWNESLAERRAVCFTETSCCNRLLHPGFTGSAVELALDATGGKSGSIAARCGVDYRSTATVAVTRSLAPSCISDHRIRKPPSAAAARPK